ncbi:DUF4199 family protein [Winogradskyella sp. 3972H.M.0a.05]|uniref:DUF4199 domain-containing protein n=1 Tax=Winogradskyella sp. 3972H.M.0a.05 TaxID=2950277 RepID=UPI003391929B
MEKSIKSSAINYGLYLGAVMSILTIIPYVASLKLLTNFGYGVLTWLAIIVLGIMSVAKSKKILNGIISFKQCLGSWVLTIAIGIFIGTLITFLIFGVIDPEAAETLKQQTIEATVSFMEGFGAPAEAIAEAVDNMEKQNQYSIGNMFFGTLVYIVIFTIIGLIVSAVMKRSDPDA